MTESTMHARPSRQSRPPRAAAGSLGRGALRAVGANQYDLGSFNEAAIIETIRQAGSISRTEIAERTGLTQQSVSRILRVLLERGLVAEGTQERAERLGKPRTPVRLRAEAAHAVGVLVDPEIVSIVLTDLVGEVLMTRSLPLEVGITPDQLVEILGEHVEEIVEASGVDTVLGVGIATPGPITPDGKLLDLPLAQWRNVPLRALLEERLGCPVVLEKDCTAAATGERWIGGADRDQDFVYLYLGTGVGAGLVLGGETYNGVSANAGEFGQLASVRTGHIDETGTPVMVPELNPPVALPHLARENGYTGPARTYAELCDEVAAGEPAVLAAAQRIASVIALGATSLVDLLDVPLVVIGGPSFPPQLEPVFLSAFERSLNTIPTAHLARQVAVEPSLGGLAAGAIGAASTVLHASFAPPVSRSRRRLGV